VEPLRRWGIVKNDVNPVARAMCALPSTRLRSRVFTHFLIRRR
jgi:hypothetical protein